MRPLRPRPNNTALVGDRLHQRPSFARQRMRAPRLGEALEQHPIARFQKEQIDAMPLFRQALERAGKRLQPAGARVDGDRHLRHRLPRQVLDHRREKGHRQVVDGHEPGVFQRPQGHRLARARKPAHQDDAHWILLDDSAAYGDTPPPPLRDHGVRYG